MSLEPKCLFLPISLMVPAWMLYKIKSLLFANQILPDANFKMDGLAPTAVLVFFFFLISLPSKSLLGLERSRIGIMPLALFGKSHCSELSQIRDHERKKNTSVFQGDLDIISLLLQRNVWVERKRDSLLSWAGALQGPIVEFNLFVLILCLCSAGELLKENTLYIQTKYQLHLVSMFTVFIKHDRSTINMEIRIALN